MQDGVIPRDRRLWRGAVSAEEEAVDDAGRRHVRHRRTTDQIAAQGWGAADDCGGEQDNRREDIALGCEEAEEVAAIERAARDARSELVGDRGEG